MEHRAGDREVRAGARLRGVLPAAARGRGQALDGAAAGDRAARDPGARAGARPQGRTRTREEAALRRARLLGLSGGARSIVGGAPGPAVERVAAGGAGAAAAARRAGSRQQRRARRRAAGQRRRSRRRSTGCGRRGATPRSRGRSCSRCATSCPRRAGAGKARPPSREFLDEALRLAEIVSQAEAADAGLAGRPIIAEGVPPVSDAELEAEAEELAGTLEPAPAEPYRHRDRDRDRRSGPSRRLRWRLAVAGRQRPGRDGPPPPAPSFAADGPRRARGGGAQPRHSVPPHVPGHRRLRRPLELARRLTRCDA